MNDHLKTKAELIEEFASLRKSEELLRKFMESAIDGFVVFDSHLNIIQINKTVEELTGMTNEEIVGKNIIDIAPDLKESGRYDKYLDVIKTGQTLSLDDVVPHPKFGEIHFNLKAFKVGEGLGIITTDITDRKQAS